MGKKKKKTQKNKTEEQPERRVKARGSIGKGERKFQKAEVIHQL